MEDFPEEVEALILLDIEQGSLNLDVSDSQMGIRMNSNLSEYEYKTTSKGYLKRYANAVTSSSKGAIFK